MLSQILSVTVSYALFYPSARGPPLNWSLHMCVHLESECPRKNDTEKDIVLSEEEAKTRIPLAIESIA
jgi:hypothetical protein